MRTVIRLLLFICIASFAYASRKEAIIYVDVGDAAKDKACMADLTSMEARLNKGSKSAGMDYEYQLIEVDTFQKAIDLNTNHDANGFFTVAATVYHGVFDGNGNYTHNVQDTKRDSEGRYESTPDVDVDQHVDHPEHCNAQGKVNTDDIAGHISTRNVHTYAARPPLGQVGPSGGAGTGYGWEQVTVQTTTSYFDSNGTLWVSMTTTSYYILVPKNWRVT